MDGLNMNIFNRKYLAALGCLWLIFSAPQAFSANKYGFGSVLRMCPFWSTPFPVGFRMPAPGLKTYVLDMEVNLIYISADNTADIDDYVNLYNVNGVETWPGTGILKGNATAACKTSSACQKSSSGTVGKGVSAYDSLAAEFTGEDIRVAQKSISPSSSSSFTWFYLPVRKYKLLRIEVFVPNQLDNGVGHSEPFFVEYRAAGNKDELQLVSMGGTAAAGNFNGVNLPDTLRLTQNSGLQIWLNHSTSTPADDVSDLLPYAKVFPFQSTQLASLPESCQ
ncbi:MULTISPECIES: hypothetical protein [Citrobacter]|uniref:Uncharacterized protein n=1 Tax=Citrobacter cronae TaxID=1748967 RepID=A0A7X1EHF0_9ENTR|nr:MULTISPECIES: hypothetical protein [Citrobacter]MBS6077379.1 hypothetical protein [Citrobacter freundii]MBC2620224.1 hypothetical protein [Citrobacter cronae]MBJ8405989.1 hypothetical protein [Citrobacter cronae]MBU5604727.1 hypothetical protein [Citrobacter sp. S55_ASV_140]MBY6248588.1 hypothetical protein [Citrobacter werkmanii]